MKWLARLLSWLLLPRVLKKASRLGSVVLQQVELPDGTGWHCSIRSHKPPRYAWTGSGSTMSVAASTAYLEAKNNPVRRIVGKPDRPVLGGPEFDPE